MGFLARKEPKLFVGPAGSIFIVPGRVHFQRENFFRTFRFRTDRKGSHGRNVFVCSLLRAALLRFPAKRGRRGAQEGWASPVVHLRFLTDQIGPRDIRGDRTRLRLAWAAAISRKKLKNIFLWRIQYPNRVAPRNRAARRADSFTGFIRFLNSSVGGGKGPGKIPIGGLGKGRQRGIVGSGKKKARSTFLPFGAGKTDGCFLGGRGLFHFWALAGKKRQKKKGKKKKKK